MVSPSPAAAEEVPWAGESQGIWKNGQPAVAFGMADDAALAFVGTRGVAFSGAGQASAADFNALRSLDAEAQGHALHYSRLDDAVRLMSRHCRDG